MKEFNRKKHWENIYQTKELKEVSWFQPVPETSLNFMKQLNIAKTDKIIDLGGGDSFLVDHLLNLGFEDITVLDISASALERAKQRLGDIAHKVKWIVADAATFVPTQKYDFWHDRAAFHFLTQENEVEHYLNSAYNGLNPTGNLLIGTFSEYGPTKCSGIEIKQYSKSSMATRLSKYFTMTDSLSIQHKTPFDTIQDFIFCSFRKNN